MKNFIVVFAVLLLGSWDVCAYSGDSGSAKRHARSDCDVPVALDATKNIWLNYTLHSNVYYRTQVLTATKSINSTDPKMRKRALVVAESGNFLWVESNKEVLMIDTAAKDIPCGHVLGLVVSGLKTDGCDTSTGHSPTKRDFSHDYINEFIGAIARQINANPHTAFALIIEPAVLPFVVRNPYINTCKTVQKAYNDNVASAIKLLDLPNAITYLDAAHGGFFGWTRGTYKDSSEPLDSPRDITAHLHQTWLAAGGSSLKQFRGVATNVGSYNSWDMRPGETFRDEIAVCADLFNRARNEQLYLRKLKDQFKRINSSIPLHGIMDVTRNAIPGIRQYWHDWCNINHAGFGIIPNLESTKYVSEKDSNFDSFVWATPAGFSDGTSDMALKTFRVNCTSPSSFQPMPEKGVWSQDYFEMMLSNTRWDPDRIGASNVAGTKMIRWESKEERREQHEKLVRRCDR